MEIKEWLVGGGFVVGGIVYGASQVSFSDVLSEDLRHFSEVSIEERPAYMDSVVKDLADNFDVFAVPVSEEIAYVGTADFKSAPKYGAFKTILTHTEQVPNKHVKLVASVVKQFNICEEEDAKMFTNQGWTYELSVKNLNGSHIYSVNCTPSTPKLRTS